MPPSHFGENFIGTARSLRPAWRQPRPVRIDHLAYLAAAGSGPIAATFELVHGHPNGLVEEQVRHQRQAYGDNVIATEKPPAWWRMILRNLRNPFDLVLMLLIGVSVVTDVIMAAPGEASFKSVITLSLMIILSQTMRLVTEYRSTRAAESLRRMVRTKATVIRRIGAGREGIMHPDEPVKQEVPFEEVVVGDLVHLSAGDMVCADVRLVRSKDLFISQSILTGEAMPVEKYDTLANVVEKQASGNLDRTRVLESPNLCFMGTNVISGSGVGVVVATGDRAYFGRIARDILGHRSETSFDKGVKRVSWVLIRFMMVMVPVIVVINGLMKHDWWSAFLFGVAVAVGLTPEMLPMVVTANLAKGAWNLAKRKCVVKRLNAIQNLGAMDILCTDKTGTLTQDRIILDRYLDCTGAENDRVLTYAYLNSYYQTGLKNLIDKAVLDHHEQTSRLQLPLAYRKIDEVPFDFVRRRMSVVVAPQEREVHELITKGAAEEVLQVATCWEDGGMIRPLDAERRRELERMTMRMNEDGLRVLLVARREFPANAQPYTSASEQDLIVVGLIGFLDPPKETAKPAINALDRAGIRVKIITGDNAIVASRVCREVGIDPGMMLLGHHISGLADDQLADLAERTTLFAKVDPTQKARIITALKSRGHTVGYLGDGINDAGALREADVGISVDSGSDIAKESSDIILLEKSLLVLEEGVLLGRGVYGNITKYIKMTASSNFGNVFSVLVASAFIPFLPMLPIHLLIQNLLYDLSQLALPWDRMDREFLEKPRAWDASGLAKFMIFIGPISSIFDITTYALMWYVFGADSEAKQSLFQSGWFVEGLLSQTLIVHMIRTQKIPFIQSTASLPVMIGTCLVMAFGIAFPFTALASSLGLQPLPGSYFPWLVATLIAYCVLTQVIKSFYIRWTRSWL